MAASVLSDKTKYAIPMRIIYDIKLLNVNGILLKVCTSISPRIITLKLYMLISTLAITK